MWKKIKLNFRCLYFFLTFNLLINSLLSEDIKDYKFNWYPSMQIKGNVINLPNAAKFESYKTSGVWEDNLGNYGIMNCLVSQFTDNESKISLDGYCEAKDSVERQFWVYLNRKSFNLAGVGTAKYLFAEKKYNVLLDKTCPYAAQLIDGGGIFKLSCKLSDIDHKKLGTNK